MKALAVLLAVALVGLGYRTGLSMHLDRLCTTSGGVQAGAPPVTSSVYVRADVDPYLHFGIVVDALSESRFTTVETNEALANLVYPDVDSAVTLTDPPLYYRHYLALVGSAECLQPSLLLRESTLHHRLLSSGIPSALCFAGTRVDTLASEYAVVRTDRSELIGLARVDWTSLELLHRGRERGEAVWRGFRACLLGAGSDQGQERCWGGRDNEFRCPAGDVGSLLDHLPEIVHATPHPLLGDRPLVDVDDVHSVRARSIQAELVGERTYDPPRPLAPSERADFRTPQSPKRDVVLSIDRVVIFDDDAVRRVRVRTEEIRGAVLSNLRITEDGFVFVARDSVRPPWSIWILGTTREAEVEFAIRVVLPELAVERATHAVITGLTLGERFYEFDLLERFGPAEVSKAMRLRVNLAASSG